MFLKSLITQLHKRAQVPHEQRLHIRCVRCCAKSSLCQQASNFLLWMHEIRHAIRKQN